MRLTVCAIAKNEESCIKRMLDSIKDIADEIVVCDTGSTDRTMEIAREYTDKVIPITIEPFSFAAARNEATKYCTGDWILWLDCDEYMEPCDTEQVRPLIENLPESFDLALPTMVMLTDDGIPYQEFLCERLVRRVASKWEGDMHNWLNVPVNPEKRMDAPKIRILHHRGIKSPEARGDRAKQRLEMAEGYLKKKIEQDPNDRRSMFYLAGTYLDSGRIDEAIEWFEKYLLVSDWPEERYQAALLLARIYTDRREFDKARMTISKHLVDNWRRAEGYNLLGDIALACGQPAEAEWWYKTASLKPKPVDPMFVEPNQHEWVPHFGLWQCYRQLGDHVTAIKHGRHSKELGGPDFCEIIKHEKDHTRYGEQKIGVLIDRGQRDFIEPVIKYWEECGKVVRTCDSVTSIDEIATWADILFCEWMGDLAIELTKQPKKARIIGRVHGYETHSGHLQQIDWTKVDDVIFTAEYLKELAIEQCPMIPLVCNVYVVGGGVETAKFTINDREPVDMEPGRYVTAASKRLPLEGNEPLLWDVEHEVEYWSRPYEYAYVLDELKAGEKVLDIGSGRCDFIRYISDKGVDVTGCDIDQECIDWQKEHNPHIPVYLVESELPGNEYDAVTMVSVLEHVPDKTRLLENCYKVLRDGGRLILTLDIPRVTVDEMKSLLRKTGFIVGDMPSDVPEDAVGGKFDNGWRRCDDNPDLRVYMVTAYKQCVKDGFRVAMACYGNQKKNFPLALQIMAKLPEEYTLHIATEWQDHRLEMYVNQLIDELGLNDRVFFYPWQEDLNAFYADKSFYLSSSEEESFHYSLAEAMACGLKPVIHCWKSARDWYADQWIFKTADEAAEMILAGNGDPAVYRLYAIEHLDISKNLQRIDRIMSKPYVAVCGEPSHAYAFEYKLSRALESLGCRTDNPEPDVIIIVGTHPRIEPFMDGKFVVYWVDDKVYGEPERDAQGEKERAEVVKRADLVIVQNYHWIDKLKSEGAKRVEYLPLIGAVEPFRKLNIDKCYDVGFMGHDTPHRSPKIDELGKEFDVTVLQGCYDHQQINEFFNQCRIVINLHAYDDNRIEWRIAEAMSAGACVVSEKLPEHHPFPYGTPMECEDIDEMKQTIRRLLNNEKERKYFADKGHKWIWSKLRFERQVEKLLDRVMNLQRRSEGKGLCQDVNRCRG